MGNLSIFSKYEGPEIKFKVIKVFFLRLRWSFCTIEQMSDKSIYTRTAGIVSWVSHHDYNVNEKMNKLSNQVKSGKLLQRVGSLTFANFQSWKKNLSRAQASNFKLPDTSHVLPINQYRCLDCLWPQMNLTGNTSLDFRLQRQ